MGLAYRGEYKKPAMIELELERMDAAFTGSLRSVAFPVGAGCYWWGSAPPSSNWILCAGQALSQVEYPALYAVWGTLHGGGNDGGATQFSAPTAAGLMVRAK
jgi:hypothetical protein